MSCNKWEDNMKEIIMLILCTLAIITIIVIAFTISPKDAVGYGVIFGCILMAIDAIIEYKKSS